jgi:O-antigen/teichoic acid export membrane protein
MPEGRVAKNTAYLVAAFVGQKLLSFVYFTLAARAVGVEGAGKYVAATAFTTIFSIFVDLGLSNVLVRETAKFPDKAGELLSNVLGIKTVLATATVIAATVTARLLGYPSETLTMIAIASAVMVLDSIHLVFYAVIRGFQDLRYEAIGVVTGQFVTIASGSVFIFGLHLPLPFLIVALLLGSTWNVVWSSWAVTRRFPIKVSLRYDRAIVSFLASVALPFALAGVFSRVYSYIDSVMLSRLATNAELGVYGVAYKLTFAFQFLPMSFAAAVYPAMADYYVKDRAKLGRIFAESVKYLLIVVVPLTCGIATLAEPIVRTVYGRAFMGAVAPLQMLIFSLVFAFIYWPCGSLLNACDRQVQNTTVLGITMAANIALNAFLIPRYGARGAAFSALVGNLVLWSGAMAFARGLAVYDRKKLLGTAIAVLFSGSFMAVTLSLLAPHLPLLLLVPAGVAVYFGVLVGMGGITVRELKDLAAVFLRRGKRISDLVEEETKL